MEKITLLNDQAIGEGTPEDHDGLGFGEYSKVLGEAAYHTPGPFTIGIYGEWGTGKTSLMHMVENYLSGKEDVITVWFNAWRFEAEEHPIVPLIGSIVRELEQHKTFRKKLEDGAVIPVIRALRAVAYGFSARGKNMIDREEALTPDPLLDGSLYFDAFQALSKDKLPKRAKVVIFIDDLDRCFPDKAVKLLESIKLVLSQPGFTYVLGVARNVLEYYLMHKYRKEFGVSEGIAEFEGQAYLDKLVQLPFPIPPHRSRMEDFWGSVLNRLGKPGREDFEKLVPIIAPALGSNPRSGVRFINNLLIDREIYKATSGKKEFKEIGISFFAISRSLQQRWVEMFLLLMRDEDNKVCSTILKWLDQDIPDNKELSSPQYQQAADLLRRNSELQKILKSDYGKEWLGEEKKRKASIDFLQTERTNADEQKLHSVPILNLYLLYHSGSPSTKTAATRLMGLLDKANFLLPLKC